MQGFKGNIDDGIFIGDVCNGHTLFLHDVPVDKISFGAFLDRHVSDVFPSKDLHCCMDRFLCLNVARSHVSAQKIISAVKSSLMAVKRIWVEKDAIVSVV